MFNTQIDAIVPMLCVTLAALASMGAEAFRRPGDRMPIGVLGVIGLMFGGLAAALLWDRNVEGFGVIAADNFGLFVTIVLVIVGVLTIMFSSQVLERDGIPAGEYYALVLFSIVGMIMMATATDLLVVFIALEVLSLSVYVLTAIRRDHPGNRGGLQVLPARRLFERLFPVRDRLHVRRDRQYAAGRGRIVSVRAVDEQQPDDPAGAGPAARGLRLQDLRRALPHVDSGRV